MLNNLVLTSQHFRSQIKISFQKTAISQTHKTNSIKISKTFLISSAKTKMVVKYPWSLFNHLGHASKVR